MTAFSIGKGIEIDVDVAKVMEHRNVVDGLVAFAIKQVLTNCHASITKEVEPDDEKRAAQGKAAAEKRLASWYAGEFTSSARGPRVDEVTKLVRQMAESEIVAKPAAAKLFKALDGKAQRDLVTKYLANAAHESRLRKAAEAIVAIKPDAADEADDVMALFATPETESAPDAPESGDKPE